MKRKYSFILACLLIALLASGCATSELEGTWVGHNVAAPESRCLFAVSGTSAEFKFIESQEWIKGTIKENQTTEPKQLVIEVTECSDLEYVGKKLRAIYKIDKQTLTLAGYEPGVDAVPSTFDRKPGIAVVVLTKQ